MEIMERCQLGPGPYDSVLISPARGPVLVFPNDENGVLVEIGAGDQAAEPKFACPIIYLVVLPPLLRDRFQNPFQAVAIPHLQPHPLAEINDRSIGQVKRAAARQARKEVRFAGFQVRRDPGKLIPRHHLPDFCLEEGQGAAPVFIVQVGPMQPAQVGSQFGVFEMIAGIVIAELHV